MRRGRCFTNYCLQRKERAVVVSGIRIKFFTVFIYVWFFAGNTFAKLANIVVILADDMGFGDVSAYNPDLSAVETKNMDKLAEGGIRFTNAHTSSAICSPTRYGLLTGEHPVRVNKLAFQKEYNDVWLEDSSKRTIADVLKDGGYQTFYVGKWHLGFNIYTTGGAIAEGVAATFNANLHIDWARGLDKGPSQRGFEQAFGHLSSADIPPYLYFENGKFISNTAYWLQGSQDAINKNIVDVPSDGTGLNILRSGFTEQDWHFNKIQATLRDKAVSYIENAVNDKPFFLYLPLSGPHTPTTPNALFQEKTPHNYTNYIAEIDGIVGDIVSALKSKGAFDNTLIIVTSDNGATSWANYSDHRGTGVLDGTKLHGMKCDIWEGGHRVPFIAHWGDVIKSGTVTNELISLQDVYRTVATIAGVKLAKDEGVDSWDILPSLQGDGTDLKIREAQFSASKYGENFCITRKDSTGAEWKLIYLDSIAPHQEFSQVNKNRLRLYNLSKDVGETKNLLSGGISSEELATIKSLHNLFHKYLIDGYSYPVNTTAVTPDVHKKTLTIKQNTFTAHKVFIASLNGKVRIPINGVHVPLLHVEVTDLRGRVLHSGQYNSVSGSFFVQLPHVAQGVVLARLSVPQ